MFYIGFEEILGNIFAFGGSVNFYMFHGGTNFGFMNGGNVLDTDGVAVFPHYAPTVTSYGKTTSVRTKSQVYNVNKYS